MYSYNFSQDTYGNGIGIGALTTSLAITPTRTTGLARHPLIYLGLRPLLPPIRC